MLTPKNTSGEVVSESEAGTVSRRPFGKVPDGRVVEAWTLIGSGGLEVELITFGGIVTRIVAPDREGKRDDLVLGFDSLQPYLDGHPFFGAITGRIAGRLSNGTFELEGKRYGFVINDPPNHLHGGENSLDKKLWSAEAVAREDGAPSVRLGYHSPDGEEGYPGNVDIAVTYTVTPGNEFIWETEAAADQVTPISITHHSYFNLAGEGSGEVRDHEFEFFSDTRIPSDENMGLSGQKVSVEGTPSDFRQPRRLGDVVEQLWMSHGDLYWLGTDNENAHDNPPLVSRAVDPASGRVLETRTTNPCLQFYTGAQSKDPITGKQGHIYQAFSGFCMECEGYPDALNADGFGDILVRPGQPQHRTTIYHFSVQPA